MTRRRNQHVVKHPKGWAVRGAGSEKPTRVVPTQAEAVEIGRQIAQNQQAELLIHGRDGRIRSKDSCGRDPNPPRDKEH
jgi:hypothetical protein